MEDNAVEFQIVRECIKKLSEARSAHALVVGQRDTAVREVDELRSARATVQARLTAREKEIALSGGELPDKPFPEDEEIARLDRHMRIKQERVRIREGELQKSQAGINAQILQLEASWNALGAAISERLMKDFREAASALRDASMGYISLSRHFSSKWNSAQWKFVDRKLAIADPASTELIVNPIRAPLAKYWPAAVHSILKSVDGLRAEIDAVER